LLKKLKTCKANLTSTINADKFYMPANKPMPYFPRRLSSEPKPIETSFTSFVSQTAQHWRIKDGHSSQVTSQLPEKSTIRPLTGNLYDPFEESHKKSKLKKERESPGFFQRRKRPTDQTNINQNTSKLEQETFLYKSSFIECQGKVIDFEIYSFSESIIF
jgi:hypothetical protein